MSAKPDRRGLKLAAIGLPLVAVPLFFKLRLLSSGSSLAQQLGASIPLELYWIAALLGGVLIVAGCWWQAWVWLNSESTR